MSKKLQSLFYLICLGLSTSGFAQEAPISEKMAQTAMALWPDSMVLKPNRPASWIYEQGLMNKAFEAVWRRTGDGTYFKHIQKNIDFFVEKNGNIRTYDIKKYNIDNVVPGRSLLFLYKETKKESIKEKYKIAAYNVRKQLETHPRTSEGGFWHKKVYPNQMWLDGLYMGQPFYAEFASLFNQPEAFDDIALQFILMEKHSRDDKTGLLYHGWDESKTQKWADSLTGRSPNFWGRSMGWYAMALVDVLDYFPKAHPKRDTLVSILNGLSKALVNYQDNESGVWYQVVDKGGEKGNYKEASASAMYDYALFKGVRKGYLAPSYLAAAKKGYEGILNTFVVTDVNEMIHLNGVCKVAGLGGKPYRDGSYAYYLSEKIIQDDPKGVGPFILASVESEIAADMEARKGMTVGLDTYFNNEYKKNASGDSSQFHYTWDDENDSGFSFWGTIFNDLGAKTVSLKSAPTATNLQNLNVYIIVDPDTKKETANPHFINASDIKSIMNWVKAGGTLVLMTNDSGNVEFKNTNKLAKEFGVQFIENSRNKVVNNKFEMAKVLIPAGHPIFKDIKKVFVKEYSGLALKAPALPSLTNGDDVVMATAKVGKGMVFAIGDPWLYNEYVDGKKLPSEYENYKAAKALALWLTDRENTK